MNMNSFKKTLVTIAAAATLGALGLASTQASAGEVSDKGYNSYVGWGPSYGYNSYPSHGYNSYPSYGYGGYGHHRRYGYRYGYGYGYW